MTTDSDVTTEKRRGLSSRVKNVADILTAGGSNLLAFSSPVLEEMYETRTVVDSEGQRIPLDGVITIPHANALHRTVTSTDAGVALELGMAYGGSALTILSALAELDGERSLISIDPAESTYWRGIGAINVERSGLGDRHRLIEQPDYLALPELLRDGVSLDLAYIDGMHTFDYTLLDFFYIDRMLKVGGIVGFNDCYLPSVKRVLNFVRSHRHYREIDVGLKPSYVSRNVTRMVRNLATLTSKQDRYFQKQDGWEPEWHFYARF
jgi:predicted O-methyltransferase YrrM